MTPGLDGQSAVAHLTALIAAARSLHTAAKAAPQPGAGSPLPNLRALQNQVATAAVPPVTTGTSSAEDKVVADILANACKALNAGCFASGTRLLTRAGWRNVEDIRPGDEVLSRDERDPAAEPEWKPVEEAFRRTGCILHLHFPGARCSGRLPSTRSGSRAAVDSGRGDEGRRPAGDPVG